MRNGFSRTTPVRTPSGFVLIKDAKPGDSVLCPDGDYRSVEAVEVRRIERAVMLSVDGLPHDIIATPECPLMASRDSEHAGRRAFELRAGDLLECPVQSRGTKSGISDGVLDRLRLLGAFYVLGELYGDCVIFPRELCRSCIIEEAGGNVLYGESYTAINDPLLAAAVQEVFGMTGTGGIPSPVFGLDRSAKCMFVGGVVDAVGTAQADGTIVCSVGTPWKVLELLELFWSVGIAAASYRAGTSIRPSVLVRRSAILDEVASYEGVEKCASSFEFPKVLSNGESVFLRVGGMKWIDWGRRPMYDLDIDGDASYAAGMVSVAREGVRET